MMWWIGVLFLFQERFPAGERSGAANPFLRGKGLYLSIYLSLPRLTHGFSSSLVKASRTVFDDMITPPKTCCVSPNFIHPNNRWDNRWDNPWVFFKSWTWFAGRV